MEQQATTINLPPQYNFRVVSGRVAEARVDRSRPIVVRDVGEVARLTVATALALGARVVPADNDAAHALAEASVPAAADAPVSLPPLTAPVVVDKKRRK